jgi:hypothetical protein
LDVQVVSRRPFFDAPKAMPAIRLLGKQASLVQLRVGGSDSLSMKKLTVEQFHQYAADPPAADEKVRRWCDLPEDRYYTVAMWPEERAGEVRVTAEIHRVVRAAKISKSNQA